MGSFLYSCHPHEGLLRGGARLKVLNLFTPSLAGGRQGWCCGRGENEWQAGDGLDSSFGCVMGNLLQGLMPHCLAGNKRIFNVSVAEEHLRSL